MGYELDYVEQAQADIKKLVRNENFKTKKKTIALTTSQIRKILSAVTVLSNKIDVYTVTHPETDLMSDELAAEVKYLKVLAAYQAGRDDKRPYPVKDFVNNTNLLDRIDKIGNSISAYLNFSKYVEALVAFHKYEGGK